MGTWCTEGVKRSAREHRREESDRQEKVYYQKKAKHEEECEEKGICPKCGQKLKKKK